MNSAKKWHLSADKEALAQQLASKVAAALEQIMSRYETAQLFVSGGQSPILFFEILSTFGLNWRKINVALVDERCVPHHHTDSNTALVKQHLLINQAVNANWNDIVDAEGNPVSAPLIPGLNCIAILGMGEDSHTASLFPDAANIQMALSLENNQPYLIVQPTKAPHKRISLSAKALTEFAHLFVLIQGEKKRVVLEDALSEANIASPIGTVLKHAVGQTDIYWSP